MVAMNLMRSPLAAAVALGVTLIPSPASADIPNPYFANASSLVNAADIKSVTVYCPPLKVVYGMGGWVSSNHPGAVVLTSITPDAELSSVTAVARARPGFAQPWSVSASIVCLGPMYHPERVQSVGITDAAFSCPPSKILYGAGFHLPQPSGVEYVDEVVPDEFLDGLRVHAASTVQQPVTVAAVGVCAEPMPRYERTEAGTARDAQSPKYAIAPKAEMTVDSGSWIFGVGAAVVGQGHVFIDGLSPLPNLDGGWGRATAAWTYPGSPSMPSARLGTTASRLTGPSGDSQVAAGRAGLTADPETGWEVEVAASCIGSWH